MKTALEPLTETLIQELEPLLVKHYKEVARVDLFPELDPDWDLYLELQKRGVLRVFTARTDDDVKILVGYWFFIVRNNPHYRKIKMAADDVIFVDPSFRGKEVFDWCKESIKMLENEGIPVVVVHCKIAHDLERLYTGLGFIQHEKNFILAFKDR